MSNSTLSTNINNHLKPTKFQLTLDHTQFANFQFDVVSTSLPDVSLNAAQLSFRGIDGKEPGDKVVFSPFTCTFLVNEDMADYIEVFNWLYNNHSNQVKVYSDITLSILSSANQVNKEIQFLSAFPTNLSSLEFNVQNEDNTSLQATVTFEYTRFKFI